MYEIPWTGRWGNRCQKFEWVIVQRIEHLDLMNNKPKWGPGGVYKLQKMDNGSFPFLAFMLSLWSCTTPSPTSIYYVLGHVALVVGPCSSLSTCINVEDVVGGEFPKRNTWHDMLFGRRVLLLFLLPPPCAPLFIPLLPYLSTSAFFRVWKYDPRSLVRVFFFH